MAVVLNPYLRFNGEAEQVAEFYKSVFGGELTLSRFGDTPMPGVDDSNKDQIMHADLQADGIRLMLSDSGPMGPATVGDNISISLSGHDDTKLTNYFEALSADGGTVTMPMETAPWGDKFGMLKDKFGINWLVNISPSKS